MIGGLVASSREQVKITKKGREATVKQQKLNLLFHSLEETLNLSHQEFNKYLS
ncbi:hypothetical protein [Thermodesulfobacterium sp. TA1]|uniref:hypothetical protein n=1 Tax=Thermodesulfobacterium sp. TA1 TaxID=2234087 RepID=UPI00143CE7EE|nr:hypothetical protein [Thermodesulfobacterium sp. TA1]